MIDLAPIMVDVARLLWGDPNPHHSSPKELRWGTNGARSVNIAKGTWFDHEIEEGGGVVALLQREGIEDTRGWLAEHGFDNGVGDSTAPRSTKPVAKYDYVDETGELLFQVCRLKPKTFRQRRKARPDDPPDKVKHGWAWSVQGVRQVPYRLPELLEAIALEHPVYIVEGEKDVETLARKGIVATTNAGGAGKWRRDFAEHLRDADVIVIPDNDVAGKDHARAVAESLVGKAARIRLLELPDLAEKGDVSDWLAVGNTVERLNALAEAAPDWTANAGKSAATETPAGPVQLLGWREYRERHASQGSAFLIKGLVRIGTFDLDQWPTRLRQDRAGRRDRAPPRGQGGVPRP